MFTGELEQLARLIRVWMVEMTTKAGSGHLTSSLSAVELMTGLLFGGYFHFDLEQPHATENDHLIFSKGHASPLFYSLWAAAGALLPSELSTFRQLGSVLEGHPTKRFGYCLAPTGSLGQGLGIGLGMALSDKRGNRNSKTFVLLGDSELAEGSVWEAIQSAGFYQVANLVAIVDVNRLGQRGETMWGWDLKQLQKRFEAFGWEVGVIEDGHDFGSIESTYYHAFKKRSKPVVILARTVKGKGISFLENKEGWHGKALSLEQKEEAMVELGDVDRRLRGEFLPVQKHVNTTGKKEKTIVFGIHLPNHQFSKGSMMAVREAYSWALLEMGKMTQDLVVLDAEVGNSTGSEAFEEAYPERYWQGYIAEQNLLSVAQGMSLQGDKPFLSTFAAFLTRAHDQLRMAALGTTTMVVCGSHAGVSIGEDGASQMGLEDIAMTRSLWGSIVLYPADGVAMARLAELAYECERLVYLRSTRAKTPILYSSKERFEIGGSKTLRCSVDDRVTLVSAGITLHECLKAHEALKAQGIVCRVIDVYSIKPIDVETLVKACKETSALIVVEDHYSEGGIVEAVRSALIYEATPVHSLAVTKKPVSGTPEELLDYEGIGVKGIVERVRILFEK